MARSDKLYDKSPKLERGADDKVAVKKGGDKKAETKDDSHEPDGSPLPDDTKAMHERHLEEMKDMHKRHQKEVESKTAGAGEGEKKTEKDKKE